MNRTLPLLAPSLLAALLGLAPVPAPGADRPATDLPRAADPRLRVDLFAAAPDIVQPVCIDIDRHGRLLVIESHTHFRPPGYKGPKYDRIRVLEDTDGDGKADRFTTFFEGTTATMDIAVHPDGSVYLATRNEVLRLRDTHGDGKADEKRRIVFLDTKGNYPHNGLSGLCFDSKGDLFFGMGENLGADYKLIGSDGTTIVGGGEGGNVFWCTADGRNLRRVATGFWNPFGTCRDIFGRLFAVDNDPDAMPPCRMVHVVESGDYGFEFRYGRAGRHPFQSWDGQLTGTLPMMTGVGEAPCAVLSYESDGLPREYLGHLLVASWADHRVERYVVKERGASYAAEPKPFVQGGKDFRPVGLAVAPDGSLFVSDWVLRDYNLHGHGAIWHVRPKDGAKPDRPTDPRKALLSLHRPLRESAARKLAADDGGREFLRKQHASGDVRTRAASLTALIDAGDAKTDLAAVADRDASTLIRAMAVRALVTRGTDVHRFLGAKVPAALRREAVAGLRTKADAPRLLDLLGDADPFLRSAAVHQLAGSPDVLAAIDRRAVTDAKRRAQLLLAWRATGRPEGVKLVAEFLADPDEDVRFLAAKWVSDEKLTRYRPQVVEALANPKLNVRMYLAYSTALARLDGQEVNEAKLADYFLVRLADDRSPAELRAKALQMVPPTHPKLTIDLLGKLLAQDDTALQLEAIRTLAEHRDPKRGRLLLDTARNAKLSDAVRAQAVLGLSERSQDLLDDLLRLAEGESATLRDEALRALVDTKLTAAQRERLAQVARHRPESAALVARVLGQPFAKGRPAAEDTAAWLKRLDGPADADAGRRVFAHPKLAGCFRCHRVEGRGQEVGPDLSTIGRTERRGILESILQPSAEIAPYYQAWRVETKDGKVRTGLLSRTNLDEYTYLDEKGSPFKVNTRDVVEVQPLPTSIMPAGLMDRMTDRELRDLLAYLCSRR
jgi:putative membrane-bound dehydrogenase-like protein